MTVLETERLHLRRLETGDARYILTALNEPSFIRFVADRRVRTLADAENYIREKIRPSYQEHGFGFYLVSERASGDPVGMCGLIKRETMDDVEIGWSLLEKYWGKGYAFEAARAVRDHALNDLRLARVVAATSPLNERSIRLIEKLGLRFERMVQLPGFEEPSKLFV